MQPPLPLSFLLLCLLVGRTNAQFWMENIPRQGSVTFGTIGGYPVFRNVKLYGAKGDGVTDDTMAINNAIAAPGIAGNSQRCGQACNGTQCCPSSTLTPAIVYFPPGNYSVTQPMAIYYFTQMVGDALNPPTIFASATWKKNGSLGTNAVFDANPYVPGTNALPWSDATNTFYRQIRNFVFDLNQAPNGTTAIHWQVAQATSLQNVAIYMKPSAYGQTGVFMENGSGGFFSDVVINGGNIAMGLGSQQFTTRNVTITNAATAVSIYFDWSWTFSQINIADCTIGFDLTSGGFTNLRVASVILIDSVVGATLGIKSLYAPGYSSPQSGGQLMLERVDFTDSPNAIAVGTDSGDRVILAGGQYIDLYAQGNAWTNAGQDLTGQAFNGTACAYDNITQNVHTAQELTIARKLAPIPRPSSLVDGNGNIYGRSRPQYPDTPITGFLSAKTSGLAGDGVTDDTMAMRAFFLQAANAGQIAYFDKGAYVITDTVLIPNNLKITGELLPILMVHGANFQDQANARVAFQVGNPGETGTVEMTDLVFETLGPAPGAIILEWNIKTATQGAAGMWDVHWRIGASAGTGLQGNVCAQTADQGTIHSAGDPKFTTCAGAFLLLHVTPQADGYFENVWGWVSDHDLDQAPRPQVDIYSGRGALIESANGPVWMWGTAMEHSVLYDYSFNNAKNVWAGLIQHETAYFQGNPDATLPYTSNPLYGDPDWSNCTARNCARTWGARFIDSSNIYVYGAGLYNFFENYFGTECQASETCQERITEFSTGSTEIYIWGLSTEGTSYMASWDGTDLIPQAANKATYVESIILFEFTSSQ